MLELHSEHFVGMELQLNSGTTANVDENVANPAIHTLSATDPDGNPVSHYYNSSELDGNWLKAHQTTGVIGVHSPAYFDFEGHDSHDGDDVYELKVYARNDYGNVSRQIVSVTVDSEV